jgi:NmrA-like family
MSYKPLVLVIGPTGSTGLPIVNALLESGDFVRSSFIDHPPLLTHHPSTPIQRVAGLVRPDSSTSPGVKSLRDKDVAIHALDWVSAPLNELTALLKNEGVEILISACSYNAIDEQTKLVDAAKAAGTVKRFIPSNWASVCPPGVMALEDRVSGRFLLGRADPDACLLIPET